MSEQCAKVLIFRGVKPYFTYVVPPELATNIQVGQQVSAPFGSGHVSGLVCDLYLNEGVDAKARYKSITSILPDQVPIDQQMVKLVMWVSEFYLVTPYTAYQTVVGKHKRVNLPPTPEKLPILSAPYPLTDEQRVIVDTLSAQDGFYEALVQGVTGSGKTEVYLQLVAHVLSKHKSSLILIPEIGLTPQLSERFESRFPGRVAVLHSGLSPVKRNKTWQQIQRGDFEIVIGPRSALFAPLKNLGLIVIDETHDMSFKQDSQPRYYAHDIARFLARDTEALLVHGSATPAVDLIYRARHETGMGYFVMHYRANAKPLPEVRLVDMRMQTNDGEAILSQPVRRAIAETLAKQQKVMILLNRRGYSTYVLCGKCQKVHVCPTCKLSLTYHRDRSYQCHRCHVRFPFTTQCSFCQRDALKLSGLGIQKVDVELMRYFPSAKILRMDRDIATTAKKIEATLAEFRASGDILLGTQMIAKGHDIPEVTLVIVLGIDATMNLPDFSATERTFQLITQVAGRAGRGEHSGYVMIQTHYPEHYAMVHASTHDMAGFYTQEIGFREAMRYPPFSELLLVIFSSEDRQLVQSFAQRYAQKLSQLAAPLGDDLDCLGPAPAPIERVGDYYRWHLLLKTSAEHVLEVKEILKALPVPPQNIRLLYDLSPKSVL